MKNLTRKLFLSICTLAICAVTLVSTTFAWYTTNTEVTANNINGATNAATDDSNLLIANEKKTGDEKTIWTSIVDVKLLNKTGSLMTPLQFNNGTLYTLKADAPDTDYKGTPYDTTQAVEFTLYFKTNKNQATMEDEKAVDIPVYIQSISLENTGDVKSFDNLLYGEAAPMLYQVVEISKDNFEADKYYTKSGETYAKAATYTEGATYYEYVVVPGLPTKETYSVDITRALNMYTTVGDKVTSHLDFTGFKNSYKGETGLPSTGVNALNYYNSIMEDNIKMPDSAVANKVASTSNTTSAIRIGDLKWNGTNGYSELEVKFVVYLDGWDLYCFDACKGQSFNMSISFTTDVDQVQIGTSNN